MGKIKVTLSIPEDTNEKLQELAKLNGMTKSGLVNFFDKQIRENRRFVFLKRRVKKEGTRVSAFLFKMVLL